MELSRRRLLVTTLGLLAAPAIVRVGAIMPVKALPLLPAHEMPPMAFSWVPYQAAPLTEQDFWDFLAVAKRHRQ